MQFRITHTPFLLALLTLFSAIVERTLVAEDAPKASENTSFYNQVRPIFQAHCQGCHQPAKPSGGYVMTVFDRLAKGGESGETAVVPGKPDSSHLISLITPVDGKAQMPKDKPALSNVEIEIVKKWISEGAADDTPAGAKQKYDAEHPPVYSRPPVITSMDYSPDGTVLAIAGFHEVLLVKSDGSQLLGRLVGISERIESVQFSPDGGRLAVTGGLPARTGEVQIWDVASKKLTLSVPITFDTIYGGSWSPDGKLVAFGCADNTVRAISAESGEQVLFQGAHNDWVRDTVFSVDGSHLVSVGRDMTTKLTEVATQRFVDNLTSITPGALKGGIMAVTRHPSRDEIVVGGSDSEVKVYRMFRATSRVIGDDANLVRKMPMMKGRVFSVAVSRDGKRIAAGAALDGVGEVHVYSYEFDTTIPDKIKAINSKVASTRSPEERKELDAFHVADVKLIAQASVPKSSVYSVAFHPDGNKFAAAGTDGTVRVFDATSGSQIQEFSPAPISITQNSQAVASASDFVRDVNPVLSRLGCNQGTCHGAAKGKNGFKLSLRGYDPIEDVRAFTDDLASRRVNLASPDDSLMLLKATNAVPHVGGQIMKPGEPYYQLVRDWISRGAILDLGVSRVASIEISPLNPVLEMPGAKQSMTIVATYSDGTKKDVTKEAFVETGNGEVATADRSGVMTALRRGEAPVLARFEGAYAATTLTVMGDRKVFAWEPPPTWGRIDELTATKWQLLKIRPSGLCTDPEFIRRLSLDLTGLPPSADDVRAFLSDPRESRVKRDALVDRLIGNDDYIEYWTNKWADLLQVNRKFLAPQGASAFRQWIRAEVAANTPYDQFARKIITASGSNRENPAASYFKVLRTPQDTMENTTHLFLAVRFNCNKCHDHPFERWTQDQYYQTAAFFSQFDLQRDPMSGDTNIGGTAVEGAKPLYEIVSDRQSGDVTHERTGSIAPPKFPFDCSFDFKDSSSRRENFASWLTSVDNPYFARSYVNRLWGYLLGVGIMEPIDDIRAGNPPTNPELLEFLTDEFTANNFDARHILRMICKSRTYQLSVDTNEWNADDKTNYSHAVARRLPAEVLYDTVYRVTGSTARIPGVADGTRAAALPDSGIELPSGFFTTFGRPARESACECERTSGLQLGPVMALISGPTIADAISDNTNALSKLVTGEADDRRLINEVFLRILNRTATDAEINSVLATVPEIERNHEAVTKLLKQREAEIGHVMEKREKDRLEAIAAAKNALDSYQVELQPKRDEMEKQRQERIAKAAEGLKQQEDTLKGKMAEWVAAQKPSVKWHLLDPKNLRTTNSAKITKEADGSILVERKDGPVVYTFVADTDVKDITGVQLEVLADERLPSYGPGFADNGNFVLTELELKVTEKGNNPRQGKDVKFEKAVVDFHQPNLDAAALIDGKKDAGGGWAIAGQTGISHWAVLSIKEPIGYEGGSTLTISMENKFADRKHTLGKFRLWVTQEAKPLEIGLPAEVTAVLEVAADQRSEDQNKILRKYFNARDEEWRKRLAASIDAQKPLPPDLKLESLKSELAVVERPVPPDPKLTQLQNDFGLSTKQLENRRLTVVQDLAWALINSPEFLFNH